MIPVPHNWEARPGMVDKCKRCGCVRTTSQGPIWRAGSDWSTFGTEDCNLELVGQVMNE